MKKYVNKKILLFFLVPILIVGTCFLHNFNIKYPFNFQLTISISQDIEDAVNDRLEDLNKNEFDDVLNNLTESQKKVFGQVGFGEKIKNIISGKDSFNFSDIVSFFVNILVDNLKGIVPVLATICAVAILSSILLQLRGKSLNKPLGDVIHFACYAVVVLLVLGSVIQLVNLTNDTLNLLKSQMEISFPVLLTLMASLGATGSVSIYQPLVAVLSGAIMQLFTSIVLPIFIFSLIFNVIGNMTSSVKISKLASFFDSLFKYVIGFTFTIFSGFMAVSGIMAGSYDGVSIRATKYAIKSYIPIMGGYLSDGFSMIMTSSVLIKNAIGYSGLIIMFVTIASPLLKIVLYKLGLNLVSGIIEPVADSRITNFVAKTSKSLNMLTSVILAFSFAYLICVGLIMCTSNVL